MDVEDFIARWTTGAGGAERANYQMFLCDLCDVIGVPRPDPAGVDPARNDYVFERAVRPRMSESSTAPRRIDLYRADWGQERVSQRVVTTVRIASEDCPPLARPWDAIRDFMGRGAAGHSACIGE